MELLENSFAIWLRHEAGQPGWDAAQLQNDLGALVNAGLVDREPSGVLTLTQLGRYAGESGIEVASITRLASAMRFAPEELSASDVVALAQVTMELQNLFIPANRRSRQEAQRWPMMMTRLGVAHSLTGAMHVGGSEPFMATKRAVACLLFITDEPLANIEQTLLQHTIDNAAAGAIRSVAARTRDVIGAVFQVALFTRRTVQSTITTDDLGLQLEIGLPERAVPLARLFGTELTRGNYLALLHGGISTPDELLRHSGTDIESLVGPSSAERISEILRTQER